MKSGEEMPSSRSWAAFRSNREFLTEPFSWPKGLTLENFTTIFTTSHVLTYIKNSAIVWAA